MKFMVFLVHFKWVDGWSDADYDTIGQYSSMDELLEKCKYRWSITQRNNR